MVSVGAILAALWGVGAAKSRSSSKSDGCGPHHTTSESRKVHGPLPTDAPVQRFAWKVLQKCKNLLGKRMPVERKPMPRMANAVLESATVLDRRGVQLRRRFFK